MINNWFKSPSHSELNLLKNSPPNSFGNHLYDQHLKSEGLDQNLAFITFENGFHKVREALSNFSFPFEDFNVIDLGKVRNEDPSFIIPLLQELIENNTIPIIFSKSKKYSNTLCKALHNVYKKINHTFLIDNISKLQNGAFEDLIALEKVKDVGFIAYQKHFCDPVHTTLPKCNLNTCLSLGQFRDDFNNLEPTIRNLNSFTFDLNAVRYSEFKDKDDPNPCGLNSEEFAQIARCLGLSENLKGIHFCGYDIKEDSSATLIATSIWYLIEGMTLKLYDKEHSGEFVEYSVILDDQTIQMTFWKSPRSKRWWVEVPNNSSEGVELIPCSEKEYLSACKNIISDKLLSLFS